MEKYSDEYWEEENRKFVYHLVDIANGFTGKEWTVQEFPDGKVQILERVKLTNQLTLLPMHGTTVVFKSMPYLQMHAKLNAYLKGWMDCLERNK